MNVRGLGLAIVAGLALGAAGPAAAHAHGLTVPAPTSGGAMFRWWWPSTVDAATAVGQGCRSYWNYEKFIKESESRAG